MCDVAQALKSSAPLRRPYHRFSLAYLELEVRPSNGRRLCCGAQLEPKLPASHDQSSAGSHGDEGRGGVTERSRPDEEEQKSIAAGGIS